MLVSRYSGQSARTHCRVSRLDPYMWLSHYQPFSPSPLYLIRDTLSYSLTAAILCSNILPLPPLTTLCHYITVSASIVVLVLCAHFVMILLMCLVAISILYILMIFFVIVIAICLYRLCLYFCMNALSLTQIFIMKWCTCISQFWWSYLYFLKGDDFQHKILICFF